MILFVTLAPSAADCATRLQHAIGEPVTVVSSFADALVHLRASASGLVILDRNLLEAEPHELKTLWSQVESAIVIEINLALTGVTRLIEEVRSARKRSEHNQAVAGMSATRSLQAGVNQTLTTLLLDCDLATQMKDLPSAACERLGFIRAHVEKLREQLTLRCTN